ncbi:hypothetical protein TUM19329_28640 [Legionella antarctica]|uniref:Uncharacterized protein n=1 Tax=Legionella antarctica TaxID=2708020 RepID=A0A6F8T8G6_9GAMM|nr:hypothetical protein TUM19329_28640 [Legionella antarctica]
MAINSNQLSIQIDCLKQDGYSLHWSRLFFTGAGRLLSIDYWVNPVFNVEWSKKNGIKQE